MAFAICSLNAAEKENMQIEKERLVVVLALTWGRQYVYGPHLPVHSDLKPLQTIAENNRSLPVFENCYSFKFQPRQQVSWEETRRRCVGVIADLHRISLHSVLRIVCQFGSSKKDWKVVAVISRLWVWGKDGWNTCGDSMKMGASESGRKCFASVHREKKE